VLTSRPREYEELRPPLRKLSLADIDVDEDDFFERWTSAIAPPETDARRHAEAMRRGLTNNPLRPVVSSSRLLATLLVAITVDACGVSPDLVTSQLRSPTQVIDTFIRRITDWELGRSSPTTSPQRQRSSARWAKRVCRPTLRNGLCNDPPHGPVGRKRTDGLGTCRVFHEHR